MTDIGPDTPPATDDVDDDGATPAGDDALVQIQIKVPRSVSDRITAEAKARLINRDVLLTTAIPAGLDRLIPVDEVKLIAD